MKKIIQKILQFKLYILTSLILKRYKPVIISISGSVGKTSAKMALAAVLSKKLDVRFSKGNYNNEIGVPLTVIGVNSPGGNIFGWLFVFIEAFKLIIFKKPFYN